MELIDRAALIASASKYQYAVRRDSHPYEAVKIQGEAFQKMVDEAPTIDAVPVVRCRDCKHRGKAGECPMCFIETYTFDEGDGYMCSGYDDHDNTQDGGFCDMGERRCDDA